MIELARHSAQSATFKETMPNRLAYFAAAVFIFLLEIAIARGIFGRGFIRGSVGDILAIMLLYTFFRACTMRPPAATALLATVIGFVVEILQYFHFASLIGLKPGSILSIMLGTVFSFQDLLMYCIGGALAYGIDQYLFLPRTKNKART